MLIAPFKTKIIHVYLSRLVTLTSSKPPHSASRTAETGRNIPRLLFPFVSSLTGVGGGAVG